MRRCRPIWGALPSIRGVIGTGCPHLILKPCPTKLSEGHPGVDDTFFCTGCEICGESREGVKPAGGSPPTVGKAWTAHNEDMSLLHRISMARAAGRYAARHARDTDAGSLMTLASFLPRFREARKQAKALSDAALLRDAVPNATMGLDEAVEARWLAKFACAAFGAPYEHHMYSTPTMAVGLRVRRELPEWNPSARETAASITRMLDISDHAATTLPLGYFTLQDHTGTAFIAVDHPTQSIIVTFRGTATDGDLVTDLDAEPDKDFLGPLGLVGSRGFCTSVWRMEEMLTQSLAELRKAYPDYRLFVTGHSLGGAQASLFGLRGLSRGYLDPSSTKVVTFGAPPTVAAGGLPPSFSSTFVRSGLAGCFTNVVFNEDLATRSSCRQISRLLHVGSNKTDLSVAPPLEVVGNSWVLRYGMDPRDGTAGRKTSTGKRPEIRSIEDHAAASDSLATFLVPADTPGFFSIPVPTFDAAADHCMVNYTRALTTWIRRVETGSL